MECTNVFKSEHGVSVEGVYSRCEGVERARVKMYVSRKYTVLIYGKMRDGLTGTDKIYIWGI